MKSLNCWRSSGSEVATEDIMPAGCPDTSRAPRRRVSADHPVDMGGLLGAAPGKPLITLKDRTWPTSPEVSKLEPSPLRKCIAWISVETGMEREREGERERDQCQNSYCYRSIHTWKHQTWTLCFRCQCRSVPFNQVTCSIKWFWEATQGSVPNSWLFYLFATSNSNPGHAKLQTCGYRTLYCSQHWFRIFQCSLALAKIQPKKITPFGWGFTPFGWGFTPFQN